MSRSWLCIGESYFFILLKMLIEVPTISCLEVHFLHILPIKFSLVSHTLTISWNQISLLDRVCLMNQSATYLTELRLHWLEFYNHILIKQHLNWVHFILRRSIARAYSEIHVVDSSVIWPKSILQYSTWVHERYSE